MPIRRTTVEPPFSHVAGDTYQRVGNVVRQYRGGVQIDQRAVQESTLLTAQVHAGGSAVSEFFEEQRMAGIVQTLVNVIKNNTTGTIRFKFADGTDREFPDFESLALNAQYLDTTPQVAQDMLILKTIRNSPDGANLENMIGGSVAIDFNANVPVVMTVE